MTRNVPRASGLIDNEYLNTALARAALPKTLEPLSTESLLGGRTGADVIRLRSGARSYVLKLLPEHSWRGKGMGCPEGGEPRLWLSGLLSSLSGPIRCPIVDVSYDPEAGKYWMLMHDVADGIRGRGDFGRDDSRALFRALSTMHAALLGSDALAAAPLPTVGGTTRVMSEPLLKLAGRPPHHASWLDSMLDGFQVLGAFLPIFLDCLGNGLADDYLDMIADENWKERLDALPATLVHGDLRRANISFQDDEITIFDWEFAAKGPPGSDLQWHCLLHYWAYPPDGLESGDDCDALFEDYVNTLEVQTGQPVDRAELLEGWQLGWIKVMAQLGYVLVDPLYPDGGNAEVVVRIKKLCKRAVRRALAFRESLG